MKKQFKAQPYFVCDPVKIVNVASVPQRSPFRYPGGKTWLVPYIRVWLKSTRHPIAELIEPFAGGGIVGLTAAFEDLAAKVRMVELDPDVAAVWQTILNKQGKWLTDRIIEFRMSSKSVQTVLNSTNGSIRERAFATLLRNRVRRGGILAAGAGLLRNGENAKGISSRWYPETLRRRILEIKMIKHRIQFVHGDGLECLKQNVHKQDVAFFIDPPYTVAGRRLYTHSHIDHELLFSLVSKIAGDFLMTYDNSEEIRSLSARFGFDVEPISMKSTHHGKLTELLIGRDLDWARFR
jgi:DNA adenine methylase